MIDAHQHFWFYKEMDFPWIKTNMTELQSNFMPEDLLPLLNKTEVKGTVVVQARQSIEETEWLLKLADQYPFILGVVGWVNLCAKDVDKELRLLAQNKHLKGVRHVIHDEPDLFFMKRKDFRNGISRLVEYSLTYDLLVFPEHLTLARELVIDFPKQKFVLDHIGKPNIKHDLISPWKEDIKKLALNENVFCKVSGMVTETDINNWSPQDFYKYLDVIFEAFGPERIMIGSDWPVCTQAGSYEEIIRIVLEYCQKFYPNYIQKVTVDNCVKFYDL